MRLRALLGLLASTMLASAAHAQANLPDVTGRWSTGDCATSYYDWSFEGDLIRFRDNRARSYSERIVAGDPEGFTTVETASPGGRVPARWAYRVLGSDAIAIMNLSTGRQFTQHRCTAATALPTAPNAPPSGASRAELRLGYSPALGVEVFAQGPNWCAPTVVLRVVARTQPTFADPALAALLQRLGRTVLGPSCPVAVDAIFQGSVGNSPIGWQRSAAAADGWALIDNPAQAATGGVDLDTTLGGPAPQPTGQLQGTRTPSPRPNTSVLSDRPNRSAPGETLPDSVAPATPLPSQSVQERPNPDIAPSTTPSLEAPRPATRPPIPVAMLPDVLPLPEDRTELIAPPRACPVVYPGPENVRVPMLCTCDANSLGSGTVIGTGVYGYASAVCRAARHADVLGVNGGAVLFIPLPGQMNLVASDRNGVSSGGGQGDSFRPYQPTQALTRYFQRWLELDQQAAHPNSIRTADGRVLAPSMVYPPLPLSLAPVQPVAGTTLAMPGVNQMSIPVPPMPFSADVLSPSP